MCSQVVVPGADSNVPTLPLQHRNGRLQFCANPKPILCLGGASSIATLCHIRSSSSLFFRPWHLQSTFAAAGTGDHSGHPAFDTVAAHRRLWQLIFHCIPASFGRVWALKWSYGRCIERLGRFGRPSAPNLDHQWHLAGDAECRGDLGTRHREPNALGNTQRV